MFIGGSPEPNHDRMVGLVDGSLLGAIPTVETLAEVQKDEFRATQTSEYKARGPLHRASAPSSILADVMHQLGRKTPCVASRGEQPGCASRGGVQSAHMEVQVDTRYNSLQRGQVLGYQRSGPHGRPGESLGSRRQRTSGQFGDVGLWVPGRPAARRAVGSWEGARRGRK